MTLVYEKDGIEIHCADAREIWGEVGDRAGVMVTDPPFGIKYQSGWPGNSHWQGKRIKNDHDTSLRDDLLALWGSRPALVFGSWKSPHPKGTRTQLVWDKGPALGMGALDIPWKPSFEEIYVIGKGFHGRRDGGVIYCPPVQSMAKNGRLHPNQKPVALMEELLRKCPDCVVIDPFMGVGSTLVAARNLGIRAIGIDVESWCCELAIQRLEGLHGIR